VSAEETFRQRLPYGRVGEAGERLAEHVGRAPFVTGGGADGSAADGWHRGGQLAKTGGIGTGQHRPPPCRMTLALADELGENPPAAYQVPRIGGDDGQVPQRGRGHRRHSFAAISRFARLVRGGRPMDDLVHEVEQIKCDLWWNKHHGNPPCGDSRHPGRDVDSCFR
jgi:hypothetical protein